MTMMGILVVLPPDNAGHRLWLPTSAVEPPLAPLVEKLGKLLAQQAQTYTPEMEELVNSIRTIEPNHVYETGDEA